MLPLNEAIIDVKEKKAKSKAINPLVFGDFSEEAIINAVTQIIDERILVVFQKVC